jgi:hypothetical protein
MNNPMSTNHSLGDTLGTPESYRVSYLVSTSAALAILASSGVIDREHFNRWFPSVEDYIAALEAEVKSLKGQS